MMRVLCLALLVAVAAADGHQYPNGYPKSYPFENENWDVPAIVPVEAPNLTLDPETDTGGYIYWFVVALGKFDGYVQDKDMPYCDQFNGFCMYNLVNTYFVPPVLPLVVWNCTSRLNYFANTDFTGQAAGQKICDVGSCCSEYIGNPKYSVDQMDWHSWLDDRAGAALCGDIKVEDNYCIFVGGDFQMNCIEYHLSALDRLVVTACFDTFVRYYMDCSVFLSVYTPASIKEPPAYMAGMSNAETLVHDSVSFLQDKICHPYSYYYPSEAKGGDKTGDDDDDDDSASAAFTVAAVAFAALML